MMPTCRAIGIDIGKISFKAVWLDEREEIKKTFWRVHQQEIEKVWEELKQRWQIKDGERIVVTGRFRQMLPYPSIVERIAQEKALRFLYPKEELTLIKLGGGSFSVLKAKNGRASEFRQNPRCAVGVGSFLDQILARVGVSLLEVDGMVEKVKGLEITSRCGVTMKTDFTHLLNQGNRVEEVIAGLLDSSAKNAVALISKLPSLKILVIGGLSFCKRIIGTIKEGLPTATVEVSPFALYFEALGAALSAFEEALPQVKTELTPLTYLPALKDYLRLVTKVDFPKSQESLKDLILGLDIGSTGSKLVIFGESPVFEAYTETKGQPIQAAKDLIKQIPTRYLDHIKAIGCTGSGREIVSSLLKASLAESAHQQIFVLNEIAAHAQGALFYDSKVDTVVDIGGQDAKFIRLEEGRVIDSCLNTVCSAGTGSFLAEQLQLLGLKDVKELGRLALKASQAVDLGQHCAVFVAEQIDEAKRKGAQIEEIVAGLYYSIILNYNNRVKGLKDYGQRIFLQGKPAENLALACALAKVTGKPILVPPSPGSMGALGIAILAKKELEEKLAKFPSLNLEKFLENQVIEKKEFRCRSKEGCLEGNLCPIQVITVETAGQKKQFFWGGACDKYEKIGKSRVLAQAPQPFLEREKLISALVVKNARKKEKRTIGIPRMLETEELLPLFITFFQELGFEIKLLEERGLKFLEEGGKICPTTFCAPIQLLAGQAKALEGSDFLLIPKIIEIAKLKDDEKRLYVCPLSQAAADLFAPRLSVKVLQPFLNFKEGYEKTKKEFLKLGLKLGSFPLKTLKAFKKAVEAQKDFEEKCRLIGKKALEYGKKYQIPVVVVLGHPYIVYSPLLSAGISEILQERAIALPASCYPLDNNQPALKDIYWGYGHRLLNISSAIRRQAGVYPLWLSVYSCGPDSFLLHFFQYLSSGKPYLILESDAYTGQAGFKTRIEAFLYGIRHYQEKEETLPDLYHFEEKEEIPEEMEKDRKLLFPWMGEGTKILVSQVRSLKVESEALPMPDQAALEIARQYTSGKECLPLACVLGSLLKYEKTHEEKLICFMPKAMGPCRLGNYHLLMRIILEKLSLEGKIKILSPTSETGYKFREKIGGAAVAKFWAGAVFADLLKKALLDIRPEEKIRGLAQEVFERYLEQAEKIILQTPNDSSAAKDLWGMKALAQQAAKDFKNIPRKKEKKLKVLVTGEIYVRLVDFANNFLIRELENLGVKTELAPVREWFNYTTFLRRKGLTLIPQNKLRIYLTWLRQKRIERILYRIFAKALGWPADHSVEEILKAAKPYLSRLYPLGEAALTIGLPLLLWQKKEIAGAVLVGPFECMPSRIAETQLSLISEKTGLPVLNLSFSGEPLDKELLESFIWQLKN